MIEFSHVDFSYKAGKDVLHDFSLTIPDGGRICLWAPSGGGKTTVLRLLMGLEEPVRGVITGREGLRFSAVFQEDRLLPWKTAVENVSLFSDDTSARDMLQRLGLGDVCNEMPAALSGGMKRRVALARALCHDFDVLVLDEPLTGLDEQTKAICLQTIDKMVGKKMLVITGHDARDAAFLQAKMFTF